MGHPLSWLLKERPPKTVRMAALSPPVAAGG